MKLLDRLIEAFLKEDAALTKGSQRIMNDKKIVKNLANAVRDDADFHPAAFPAGMDKKFNKSTDEEVAHWFLESLDNIEKQGYEGIVYSRDGVNSDWIVKTYLAGSSNWEDIKGNLNMVLSNWYLLRNRNLLEPQHKELSKFGNINQLNSVLQRHYATELKGAADAAKKNALRKTAKSFSLVDNNDYRVQVPLNRLASMLIADGAGWCTANAETGHFFNSYASRGMLFILLPYEVDPETGEKGFVQKEVTVRQGVRAGAKIDTVDKYQFDTGSGDFMDLGNVRVQPPSKIADAYPYLYDDIVTALRTQKDKLESAFTAFADDPALQGEDQKVKIYDINKQIKDLKIFVDKGYFTTEKRPKDTEIADEPAGDTPQIAAPAQEQPPQEPQMETIRQLAKAMLEDKTLGHIVQQYKPIGGGDEDSPLTYGDENLGEDEFNECEGLDSAKARLAQALGGGAMQEDDAAMADSGDMGGQAATGGALGSVGGAGGGGGQYPPGTAPTMPESIQTKEIAMENVDKDVAAMLNSLKKYDKLNESVLGMVTLSMARPTVVEAGKPWENDEDKEEVEEEADVDEDKEEIEEDAVDDFKAKGGKVETVPYKGKEEKGTSFGSKHIGKSGSSGKQTKGKAQGQNANVSTKDKEVPPVVKEAADADVLDWMNRFSKLGNMKGYGR